MCSKTVWSLRLDEHESVFVLFNNKTTVLSGNLPQHQYKELMHIEGSWKINFPGQAGAPATIVLDSLSSLTNHKDEGVKYFSGSATYSKSFEVKKELGKSKVFLDLGRVGDIAEIILNGKKLDILWTAPFRIEITNALKKGKNQLEIKVTNEWTNRLAADKDAPAGKKILPIYINPFGGQYQVTDSGLMGPVKLVTITDE